LGEVAPQFVQANIFFIVAKVMSFGLSVAVQPASWGNFAWRARHAPDFFLPALLRYGHIIEKKFQI
jgi:hypothetical protein